MKSTECPFYSRLDPWPKKFDPAFRCHCHYECEPCMPEMCETMQGFANKVLRGMTVVDCPCGAVYGVQTDKLKWESPSEGKWLARSLCPICDKASEHLKQD